MGDNDVNIRIKRDTWKRLHNRKEPNDSFDDVLQRVLDELDEREDDTDPNPKATASS